MFPNPTILERLLNVRINLFIFGRPIGTGHYIFIIDSTDTDSENYSSDDSDKDIDY